MPDQPTANRILNYSVCEGRGWEGMWRKSANEWSHSIVLYTGINMINNGPSCTDYDDSGGEELEFAVWGSLASDPTMCPNPNIYARTFWTQQSGIWLAWLDVYFCEGWFQAALDWKETISDHEFGHVLGLADHWEVNPATNEFYTECDQIPAIGGLTTIMAHAPTGLSRPPCTTNPYNQDVAGVLCMYDYPACPDGYGGGGIALGLTADQDGDGVVDPRDNCPDVANILQENLDIDAYGDVCDSDDDSDGYADAAEQHVVTDPKGACGSTGMPADIISGGVPNSTNRVNVSDLTSFLAPVRRINTNLGDPGFAFRWDIVPGKGVFSTDINVADLSSLISVAPRVLGGVRAFNGPVCTSTQLAQLMDVVKAVEGYRNPQAARNAGFVQVTNYRPGLGALFVNQYAVDNSVSSTAPEGLIYDSSGRLAGVVYFAPKDDFPSLPALFAGNPPWTTHTGVCLPASDFVPQEGVSEQDCQNQTGVYYSELGWIQTAWIFGMPNPSGVFADSNPLLD